ncbi:Fic family protein [Lactovum odontotermitis]
MDKYDKIVEIYKSKNINSVGRLLTVLDSFKVLFAYNSGKIENENITYHATRDIFENGKVMNFTGDPRTVFEIENQKKAFDFLVEKVVNKEALNIELIKETHRILTEGTYDYRRYVEQNERPGEFKKHEYVIGKENHGSSPEEVESELSVIISEINQTQNQDSDKLLLAAYFHANFENIHPFADGNGRTGRILMNYYLMINDHPPLIVYDEDKNYYYAALEKFDAEEDLTSLYEVFKYEIEKTWEKQFHLTPNKRVNRGLAPHL